MPSRRKFQIKTITSSEISQLRAPANGQEQLKKTYKFVVTDRSSFYDWYNAFFEVQFKLDLKANGGDIADAATTIINGSHSLIKHMVVKSSIYRYGYG